MIVNTEFMNSLMSSMTPEQLSVYETIKEKQKKYNRDVRKKKYNEDAEYRDKVKEYNKSRLKELDSYKKNQERIKERYANDPEYRALVIERAKARNKRIKEQKLSEQI